MELFNDGRYEALGRGIYRTIQFNPTSPILGGVDVHKLYTDAMKGSLPLLEAELKLAQEAVTNAGANERSAREQVVDQINEEIKWMKVAIDTIGEAAKRRKVNAMDQKEAR